MKAICEDNDTIVLYLTVREARFIEYTAEDTAPRYRSEGVDNNAFNKASDILYDLSAALNKVLH